MADTLREQGRELFRSLQRWSRINHYEHNNISDFLSADVKNGLHSIDLGRAPLDLTVSASKGAPLIICLNGNSPRKQGVNPPFFSGFGVIPKEYPISHVAVSDPSLTLSNDLSLAWYAGARDLPIQKILPQVFDRIIDQLEPEYTMFFGGSGGGFASLYFSEKVPGSTSFVWNPQTDILKYDPNHVRKYAEVAFGLSVPYGEAPQLNKLIETELPFDGSKRNSRIIYLQNRTDWHIKSHLAPMLKKMKIAEKHETFSGLVEENFFLHIGDWGVGHAALPKEALTYILSAVMKDKRLIQLHDPYALSSLIKHALGTESMAPLPT